MFELSIWKRQLLGGGAVVHGLSTRASSTLLDLHPDGMHPVAVALSAVHEALDQLPAQQPEFSSGDFHLLVGQAERAIQRLQAVKLRLVAAADARDVSRDAGLVDTSAWLARHTRADGAHAARQVSLAQQLEELPATRSVLADGGLSVEHAGVIAHTQRRLPDTLTDAQRQAVETKLLGWARQFDPKAMRRKARQVLHDITSREEAERHHADELVNEEQRALAKSRFTIHDNHDGTMSGQFTVPTLAGSILQKVLQQLTSPRRNQSATGAFAASGAVSAAAQGPQSGQLLAGAEQSGQKLPGQSLRGQTLSTHQVPDYAHQRGLAFIELLEHLPTDRLHGKVAATVVVTIQHRQLTADLAAAGVDTGHELSPADARRIACGAGILPAILDGESLPIDLGRTKRFFTETQRVALATRHDTCQADGCDRPFAWCE